MKGAYVLVMGLKDKRIRVGALGEVNFTEGLYAYVGSAMNGVEQRVKRHFKCEKKIHWHIDYLTTNNSVKVLKAYYKELGDECVIAGKVSEHGKSVKGFGCSDCDCKSHLFKIENEDFLKELMSGEL